MSEETAPRPLALAAGSAASASSGPSMAPSTADPVVTETLVVASKGAHRLVTSEDVDMFRTLLRATLHPFAHRGEVYDQTVTQYHALAFLADLMTAEIGDPRTRRLSREGLHTVRTRLKAYVAAHVQPDAATTQDDAVFTQALGVYLRFLKKEAHELIDRPTHVIGDFLAIFSTFLLAAAANKGCSEQLLSTDGHADGHSTYSRLMWRFVDVMFGRPVKAQDAGPTSQQWGPLVPDLFHGNTPQVASSSSSSAAAGHAPLVILSPADLCEILHVDAEQFQHLLEMEQQLSHPEARGCAQPTAVRELKLRQLCLNNHAVYNKDNFIHKTAAFLKWEALESDKIDGLLRALQKDAPPAGPAKGKDDKWAVRLTITVAHVRWNESLFGHHKAAHGNFSVYCTLKAEEQLHKSQPHTNATGNTEHSWQEQFVLDLPTLDGVVKLKFWHVGSAAERSLLSSIFNTADNCLARADIAVADLLGHTGVFDKWYPLQPRASSGAAALVKGVANVGQCKLQVQALQLDKSETMVLPRYHHYFDTLVDAVIKDYVLQGRESTAAENLMEEFGKRYGVRAVYRRLSYLSKYLRATEGGAAREMWSNQRLAAFVKNITAVFSRADSPRMTSIEGEVWSECLKTILRRLRAQLGRYRDLFPLGKPELELQGLVSGITSVHLNRQYMRDTKLPDHVEAVLAVDITACCDAVYARLAALVEPDVPLLPSSPQVLPPASLVRLAAALGEVIQEDQWHFAAAFRAHMSLVDVTAPVYVLHLADDVARTLETLAGLINDADADARVEASLASVFQLFAAYKELHRQTGAVLSRTNLLPPLSLLGFRPFLQQQSELFRVRLITHVGKLGAHPANELRAVEATRPFSGMLLELMGLSEQLSERLFALTWPDADEFADVLHAFLQAVRAATAQFAMCMHSQFIDLVGVHQPDKRKAPADALAFRLSEQMIVALFTIAQTRIELAAFAQRVMQRYQEMYKAPAETVARLTSAGAGDLLDGVLEQTLTSFMQQLTRPVLGRVQGVLLATKPAAPLQLPLPVIAPASALSIFTRAFAHTPAAPASAPVVETVADQSAEPRPPKELEPLMCYIDENLQVLRACLHGTDLTQQHLVERISRQMFRQVTMDLKQLLFSSVRDVQMAGASTPSAFSVLSMASVRPEVLVLHEQQLGVLCALVQWLRQQLRAPSAPPKAGGDDYAWTEQLLTWQRLPSSKLIPLLFDRAYQHTESETVLLAILSARKGDKVAQTFLIENEEQRRRQQKWQSVAQAAAASPPPS